MDFEELYMTYFKDVYLFILAMSKDAQIAEEITQETFFKALKGIDKFQHLLEEPYKVVFTLRILGELSFREIGEIFGRKEGWARVTFHRAKLKIQETVKRRNGE